MRRELRSFWCNDLRSVVDDRPFLTVLRVSASSPVQSSRRNENTIGCRSIDRSFRRICGGIRAKGDRKIDLGENLKPIAGEVIAHSIDRQLRILWD